MVEIATPDGQQRRERFLLRWSLWVVVLVVLVLAGSYAIWRTNAPRLVLAPGEYVRYDDFAFTVKIVRREPGASKALTRYVLSVECQNRALRVPFTFKPEMVEVRASPGDQHALSPAADSWNQPVELEHGTHADEKIVVDGPSGLQSLRVWFRTGGDFGDFMDGLFGENYEFEAPIQG